MTSHWSSGLRHEIGSLACRRARADRTAKPYLHSGEGIEPRTSAPARKETSSRVAFRALVHLSPVTRTEHHIGCSVTTGKPFYGTEIRNHRGKFQGVCLVDDIERAKGSLQLSV